MAFPSRNPFVSRAIVVAMLALLAQPAFAQATQTPRLDGAALTSLEQRLSSGAFGNVHSVLVVQDSRTIVERYFAGPDERRGTPLSSVTFNADTLHDLRSVTKSVVSLLFGIAQSEGLIAGLDTPILDYFPEYPELRTAERSQIRLSDALSMTSGLHWDERTFPYTDRRNSETAMDFAADRYRYIISQPEDASPGTRFNYSGGDVALVAAIIARAAKMPIETYAEQKLFGPLGITSFEWLKDRTGIAYAASGLRLRPRDMAKIGQLLLQRGRWETRQVVPENWVQTATTAHANVQGDARCGVQYGYFWWLGTICSGGGRTSVVFATGNGGQNIWIVPSLNLVVVSTMGFYNGPEGDRVANQIILAVVAAAAGGTTP
jgi:CubicO group peptidase (beta-lactamase class C family)